MTDSPILGITEVSASQNQKEVTINAAIEALEAAFNDTYTVDFTSGDVTLTAAEFNGAFSFVPSNLGAAQALTVPAQKRFFFVDNTAGSFTITVTRGTTTVDVTAGSNGLFFTDGTANGLVQAAGGGGGGGTSLVDFKDSCRVATTGNITLSGSQTVDGVTLSDGDRVLVWQQSTGSENGIYSYNSAGAWTRTTDFDEDAEVTAGCTIPVVEGDTYNDRLFMLTTNDSITVGSTALTFWGIRIGARPYDLGGFFSGVPGNSELIMQFVFTRACRLPASATGSKGFAGVAATAQTDIDIQKNGSSIGTMRFAASGTVATFVSVSETAFAAGDRFQLVGPSSADATLADISSTFALTRED